MTHRYALAAVMLAAFALPAAAQQTTTDTTKSAWRTHAIRAPSRGSNRGVSARTTFTASAIHTKQLMGHIWRIR